MNKIYAHKTYSSKDENLFEALNIQKGIEEKGEKIKALLFYKCLCNAIRKQMDIECLVGLGRAIDKKANEAIIVINLYDVQANQDNYFQQHYDENEKKCYIEVPIAESE